MPWMWGPGFGWPGFMLMSFWSLVWLALIGLVIWAIARWLLSHSQPVQPPRYDIHPPREEPSALEILRRRYARGEIDASTLEEMRAQLDAAREREQPPIPST